MAEVLSCCKPCTQIISGQDGRQCARNLQPRPCSDSGGQPGSKVHRLTVHSTESNFGIHRYTTWNNMEHGTIWYTSHLRTSSPGFIFRQQFPTNSNSNKRLGPKNGGIRCMLHGRCSYKQLRRLLHKHK